LGPFRKQRACERLIFQDCRYRNNTAASGDGSNACEAFDETRWE